MESGCRVVGLSRFHERRQHISTPYLIEQFVRERRLREVAALSIRKVTANDLSTC
ncbi:MAG: hypothetical protein CM1200mP39_23730 [Dehalococcoidia bacterium]|nr:MAG: hypothetical protein CM1200mP39_23730 [Dehalococcoidia bacterium]